MILSLADQYPSGQFSKKHRNTTCAYNIHDFNQKKISQYLRNQNIPDKNKSSNLLTKGSKINLLSESFINLPLTNNLNQILLILSILLLFYLFNK